MRLYDVRSPLRKAGSKALPKVVLIDGNLEPRTSGPLPRTLPSSFRGAVGDRAEMQTESGLVIAIGCGNPVNADREVQFWETAGAATLDTLRALRVEAAMLGGALNPHTATSASPASSYAFGATLASYRCVGYRAAAPAGHFDVNAIELNRIDWSSSKPGRDLGMAVNWTRALVDAPANLLTPQAFAREAEELTALGIQVEVLDVAALEKLGAGGLLAVGRGSEHPPCMVICRWNGRTGRGFDLGLVGKGLTFDGGGLNLKQRPVIEKMKFDMAGGAAVLGALRVLASRKAPVNVVAAIPLAENAIDGKGYRPGDVITSLSGLTIEVDNTDAEGRIVLADAITHVINRYKPNLLVDIATLTGAIMSALHEEFAGLFTSDDDLAADIERAAGVCNENVWRLPLSKRQDYLVDSDIADVKNVAAGGFMGVGMGSAIGGAKFLERFSKGTRWAHLDIAGVAWSTRPLPGIPKGPTGFGVRLLDGIARQLTPASKRKGR